MYDRKDIKMSENSLTRATLASVILDKIDDYAEDLKEYDSIGEFIYDETSSIFEDYETYTNKIINDLNAFELETGEESLQDLANE